MKVACKNKPASTARASRGAGQEPEAPSQKSGKELPDVGRADAYEVLRNASPLPAQRPSSPARARHVGPLALGRAPAGVSHYAKDAPWPSVRGPDPANSGCQHALLAGPFTVHPEAPSAPVHFPTGGGIFSTPVIGKKAGEYRERIYVGSGDKHFYAFDPFSGKEVARFRTEECIDSAAALHEDGGIFVPSCDGSIYKLDEDLKGVARYSALERRPGFSASSIYWNEGNAVVSPNNHVVAGNDDFYLYGFDPQNLERRWANTTGLNVWSAPCFDPKGNGYGASCDATVFRFDPENGRFKWRTRTSNVIAASPTYTNGKVLIGNFSGDLVRLDAESGKIEKTYRTGGAIYGSAAVAPDGTAFVGAADGRVHWVDADLEPIATFYTGDVLRASASIGPDPENKAPYLVYVGSGNGHIYALEPDAATRALRRRWSYDTTSGTKSPDYININASIALGEHGLATASASGDVIYVPYHAYLSDPPLPGFSREPTDGYPTAGDFVQWLTPGGAVQGAPIPASPVAAAEVAAAEARTSVATRAVSPGDTISLRILVRKDGESETASFDPSSLQVEVDPPFAREVQLQPGGDVVSILPSQLLAPGARHEVRVSGEVDTPEGKRPVSAAVAVEVARPAGKTPALADLLGKEFSVSQVSVHDPSIVPSFDQIGLASQKFDFRIVDVDPKSGKFSAWGVLRFGVNDAGQVVGVTNARTESFAFRGEYKDGEFIMEAERPWFEITAWPMALDRLRLSGRIFEAGEGTQVSGGSLYAELQLPSLGRTLLDCLRLRPPRQIRATMTALSGGHAKPEVSEAPHRFSPTYLGSVATQVARSVPFARQLLGGDMARAWGAVDDAGQFRGLGTYRLEVPVADDDRKLALEVPPVSLRVRGGRIGAEVQLPPGTEPHEAPLGIMLFDRETKAPVPADYNTALTRKFDARTGKASVELSLANKDTFLDGAQQAALFDPARIAVVVLLGTQPVATVGLDAVAAAAGL